MRIYKRVWKDPKTGKRRETAHYSVRWKDRLNDQWNTWPGFEREDWSRELGETLEAIRAAKQAGRVLAPALEAWIDRQPPETIVKLAELRMVDATRVAGAQLLDDHLGAYERWRLDRGRHTGDTQQVVTRIRRVCEAATL